MSVGVRRGMHSSLENILTDAGDISLTSAPWAGNSGSETRTGGASDPIGGTTAMDLSLTNNLAVHGWRRSGIEGSSVSRNYMLKVWARMASGTADIQIRHGADGADGTASATQAVTTTWVEYTFNFTEDLSVGRHFRIRQAIAGSDLRLWNPRLYRV